jgi:hypothetical protein
VRLLAPIVAVMAVPVFGIMALHQRQHALEHRLAGPASAIAGRPVEVHCPGFLQRLVDVSPNAGSVYFSGDGRPANYTELSDKTCSILAGFKGHTDTDHALEVAAALHVLAHESFHLAGIRNEAEADCYGLQRTAFVAEQLGADPAEARRLAKLALVQRARTAPPEYRSPQCFDGGALDLDPGSSVWP